MDWKQNRLFIAAVALLALGGLAFYVARSRTGDTDTSVGERPTLPDIDRADVTALDITRPAPSGEGEPEHVRLELHDGVWHVTQPIEAPADASALDTALQKLDELEVSGLAASHAEHHAELEVDDAHGVHVVVHGADDAVLADLIIGAFRGSNTMVREAGQDRVVTVPGSIRFAFARDLKDWRNRSMLDLESNEVRVAEWVGPHGTFRFARPEVAAAPAEGEAPEEAAAPTLGDWAPTEISYLPAADADAGVAAPAAPLTTLEHFAASRVTSMISSLAHMRAADFAAADVTREAAGITDASARVTLTIGTGDSAERHTITVGNEATGGNFYAVRDGDETIFLISRPLMEKVNPAPSAFEQTAAPAAPAADEGGGDMPPMPGGGGEIPPDLMRQIQEQLRQQGVAP